MNPLHATIEEFAAEGYTHVSCHCPRCRMTLLRKTSLVLAIAAALMLPSATFGKGDGPRAGYHGPLSFAWCLGILLAWWLVALRQVAGLWLLAMDPRLDLLDLRQASLISMGLTLDQLSQRLRCAECGGPLHSVKPWRSG